MKKTLLVSIVSLFIFRADAQTISTYLGTAGSAGVSVASTVAVASAALNGPYSFYIDATGKQWIVEKEGNRLRVLDNNFVVMRAGKPTSQAGQADGTGINASFNTPRSMVMNSSNDIFIADEQNNCIRKVTAYVNVSTPQDVSVFAGEKSAIGGLKDTVKEFAYFNMPSDLAIDGAGNMYVADAGSHAIRKIGIDGNVTTIAGNGTPNYTDGAMATAQFSNPTGIVLLNDNAILVADQGNKRIRKIDLTQQTVSTFAGSGNNDFNDGTVLTASFTTPTDLVVDEAGNIYVSDGAPSNTIRMISNGVVTTIAGMGGTTGTADGQDTSSRFNNPTGLFYKNQTLYVCDEDNHTIRKITDLVVTPTGLDKTSANDAVKIYPNPTQQFIRVTAGDQNKNMSLVLTDLAGREVYQASVQGNYSTLDISSMPKGLYLLQVKAADRVTTQKVVIE